MTRSSPSWFADDSSLLDEVRRTVGTSPAIPRVPGYDIASELHRGGQGVVYSAVQRSTKRRVALKVLLDSAYYSNAGRRRFEREIDLAASLDHPSIVRVYDSGPTEEGRAYLAMQFVDGEPLDAFALRVQRDPDRVLRAMLAICDAVSFAHQRGVIHRDLKPSNILVDSQGVPHVLDFGLAKLGGEREAAPSDSMALTTTGQFLGSLPWASPEQARGDPNGSDTRSDVYSLGAVAYQMLTGALPCDVSGPLHVALTNIATQPATPVRKVRPELDEQVEIILATCLEKEPERRYQSASALAQDIRDHLLGEPIQARRESAWRGVRRTVARYRSLVLLGSVALIGVGTMSILALASASEARDQRSIAQGETRRADEAAKQAVLEAEQALRERARAQATLEFMTRTLGSADPDSPGGAKELKVADVLVNAGAQVESAYANDPLIRGELHYSLGTTLTALGMHDAAMTDMQRALQAWREGGLPESDHRILRERGNILDLRLLKGESQDVIEPLQQLALDQRQSLGETHEYLIATYSDLGMALKAARRFADAEDAFKRSLAIIGESRRGSEDDVRVRTNLAGVLADEQRTGDAIATYRAIIPDAERSLGNDHFQTIMARNNLATVRMNVGRLDEASPVFEASLASCRKLRGDSHPLTLLTLHNLGTLQHRLNHLEQSRALLAECLAGRRARLGDAHIDTILTMSNYALLLADMRQFDDAISLARESLAGRRALFGEKHSNTVIGLNAVAMTLLKAGRPEEAIDLSRQALDLAQPESGVLPKGHYLEALMQGNHARCLTALARFEEAEPELLESYSKLEATFGGASDLSRRTATYLADLYEKWDRPADAARFKDLAHPK